MRHSLIQRLLLALAVCPFSWGCAAKADESPTGQTAPSQQAEEGGESATPKTTNRLAKETSPYLLMHAHNPVDWYPWGPEALEKAKQEKKIIFLSVGYSSCHWCHVMERESFMDKEIAEFLNKNFVCIKVDREERPDVDSIYMTAIQVVSGRGGWPMTVFLVPDGRPFYGATYLPARDNDRPGATGFLTLIRRVHEIWNSKPDLITQDAVRLTEAVQQQLDGRRPASLKPLDKSVGQRVVAKLIETYDPEYGGFDYSEANPQMPKFPEPSNLVLLLDYLRTHEPAEEDRVAAQRILVGTLQHMANGGIRDHLGGGFHRYSVDRFWHIPHFEKMLYDNGQLLSVYAEAYALTKREDFRRVAIEMAAWVLREMVDKEGGFYSALDADSEHEEGKFYRWTPAEIEGVLGPDDYQLFAGVYGIDQPANFEEEFWVPQLAKTLADQAKQKSLTEAALEAKLVPLRSKLLTERAKRERPLTDTKVLTSWNGLMIRGLADAGRILERPEYIQAASRSAQFVLDKLSQPDGRLLRTYGNGQAKLKAYLNDYAFMIDGLIALHEATGDAAWLDRAEQLCDLQLKHYWDDTNGGFFFTADDHESLLARGKNPADGAQPAGNSVAANNLIYLAEKLDRPEYLVKARATVRAVSGLLEQLPHIAPRMIQAAVRLDALTGEAPTEDAEKKDAKEKDEDKAGAAARQ